jgi:CCAAT/enhancer binding protein (C/EBP) gamma
VSKLKLENEKLEEKVKLLSKELDFLKNIFLAHAGKQSLRLFAGNSY